MASVDRALELRRGVAAGWHRVLRGWLARWARRASQRRAGSSQARLAASIARAHTLRQGWLRLVRVVIPAVEARQRAESLVAASVALLEQLGQAAVQEAFVAWRVAADRRWDALAAGGLAWWRLCGLRRGFEAVALCAAEAMARHDRCGGTLASLLYRPGLSMASLTRALQVRRVRPAWV